jgi:hypothetical protein
MSLYYDPEIAHNIHNSLLLAYNKGRKDAIAMNIKLLEDMRNELVTIDYIISIQTAMLNQESK